MLKVSALARPEFKADPYPLYAYLRAEPPVCPTKLFGQRAWLVTRYDDVVSILKDERFLKEWHPATKWLYRLAGSITRHMLNRDAPDHTRLLTLVQKAFTAKMIERLRERIHSICDELLGDLGTKGRFELMRGYAAGIGRSAGCDLD